MSETPQNNPDFLSHYPDAIQDANEAHELALRVDSLENQRARYVGGMAMLAEEYVKQAPVKPDIRAHDADDAVVARLAKANGIEVSEHDDGTSRLQEKFAADGLVKKLDDSIERQNADEANRIEGEVLDGSSKRVLESLDDLQAAAEVARNDVAKVDAQLNEVYAGGLTPDEKDEAERQTQATEIVNSVRAR